MAVSPFDPPSSSGSVVSKAKALTLLNGKALSPSGNGAPTKTPSKGSSKTALANEAAADLSEQLNRETKEKYVKGKF